MTEQVRRASGRTLGIVLIVIVLFLYGIRQVLLPFVLAGAVAYACTPAVNWLTARTRLPRALWATVASFLVVGLLALLAELAVPALFAQLVSFATDTQHTLQTAIQALIGNGTVNLLGQQTNAEQLAKQALDGIRGWTAQTTEIVTLAFWAKPLASIRYWSSSASCAEECRSGWRAC